MELIDTIIERITNKKPLQYLIDAEEWRSWYSGKVDGFHSYQLYNGENNLNIQKKSLCMAKTVCEDWADLLANEKTQVELPDKDKIIINKIFKKNNFHVMLNNGIEKTFAVGNGCFVLGLKDFFVGEKNKSIKSTKDTQVTIDFVDYFDMKVLSIERGKITECAFVSENTDFKELAIHRKNEKGNYVIYNCKIDDKGNTYDEWEVDTGDKFAWFFPFRPNINNNSFMYNSLGMSIFANAIDVLKGIDDVFDAFTIEFILLRPKAYVSSQYYRMVKDAKGNMVKTFNPYDSLYYQLPESSDGTPKVQVEAPQIRYDAYINGLNTLLNMLSKKCGFGTERYKFDKAGIATATQIISENSDMARSLRKEENYLKQIIIDMVWSIKSINNKYTLNDKFSDFKYEEINVTFDDSIIEDENAMRERDRADVQAGLMSEVEYRVKHYGKTQEDAEQDIYNYFLYKELGKYSQALKDGVITPKEFILKTYGKEDTELEKYIEEHLEKASFNPLEMFNNETHEDDDNKPEENKDKDEE